MVRMLDERAKGDGAKPHGSVCIDRGSQPLDKPQGRRCRPGKQQNKPLPFVRYSGTITSLVARIRHDRRRCHCNRLELGFAAVTNEPGRLMNRSSATILVVSLSALVLFLYGAISGCSTARLAKETQRKHDTPPEQASGATAPSPSTPATAQFANENGPSSKTYLSNVQQPAGAAAPNADASKEGEKEEPKNIIEVVLSFDDGPHAASPDSGRNYTQTVFAALKDNVLQKDIRAVFFVQTHAPGRGATPIGQDMISMLAKGGHVIGIHTGSKADHASHRARATAAAYDVNGNRVLDAADGANGLESDMIRARARVKKLTGRDCLYVRPTYGERNRSVRSTYRRQGLKMILWDIDSADNTGSPSVDGVNFNLYEGMRRCVNADLKQIIILFHDINSRTALNLEEYLGNICISARKLGKTAVFPTTTERVMEILNAKDYQ